MQPFPMNCAQAYPDYHSAQMQNVGYNVKMHTTASQDAYQTINANYNAMDINNINNSATINVKDVSPKKDHQINMNYHWLNKTSNKGTYSYHKSIFIILWRHLQTQFDQ